MCRVPLFWHLQVMALQGYRLPEQENVSSITCLMNHVDLFKCHQRGICMEEVLTNIATNRRRYPGQWGVAVHLEWIPERGRYEIERIGRRPAPDE